VTADDTTVTWAGTDQTVSNVEVVDDTTLANHDRQRVHAR